MKTNKWFKSKISNPKSYYDSVNHTSICPYFINYSNESGGDNANFVVFGNNRYSHKPNYGSDAGVVITCGGGISYDEVLAQSAIEGITIKRWRFIASNVDDLEQTLVATYRDANGTQLTMPFPLALIYKDRYATNPKVLDVDFPVKVNGTFYITGKLSLGNTFSVIAFPEEEINISIFKKLEIILKYVLIKPIRRLFIKIKSLFKK